MSLHEQSVGATDEWYTPPEIFEALGEQFDLDVASPGRAATPWVPAHAFLTYGGLDRPWVGFVWMNPPFGARNAISPWLAKFMAHGHGIALTPDRTSAPWWHEYARRADRVLFIGRPNPARGQSNKIKFIGPDGQRGPSPAQGTTLMGCGLRAMAALQRAQSGGLGLLMRIA